MTDDVQFPSDWKEQIAGDNADNLKALEGFDDPMALGSAFFEQSAAVKAKSDENWRAQFTGDDEGRAKQLERISTPADFGNSYFL